METGPTSVAGENGLGAPVLPPHGPSPSAADLDAIDSASSGQPWPLSKEPGPEPDLVPVFRVEGSGDGDSSVTEAPESLQPAVPNGLSRQDSEEMPLSLVSWYSEPGGNLRAEQVCCRKSEEKENETPSPSPVPGRPKTATRLPTLTAHHTQQQQQQQRVKMQIEGTSEPKGKPVGNGCASHGAPAAAQKPECPRCSRRSKSGSNTPAAPSRTPRRQVLSGSKPIKSILKSESRGSSGSEKQSSMDSLGSNSGTSPLSAMTRSDSGPRAKFNFTSSESFTYPEDRMVSKLKNIEKYATLRFKKSRVVPLDSSKGSAEQGPRPPQELMTKSMSFLEKSTNGTGPASLRRQGSLRVRKPSPGWEPGATRTSALRLQKMQESKAKSGRGHGYQTSSSTHSGSGDSIHNNSTAVYSSTPTRPATGKEPRALGARIFSKLSSALGQTTSSAQKRLRQERAVQTEDFIEDHSESPTQISPIPPAEEVQEDGPEETIRHQEALITKYQSKVSRFQRAVGRLEMGKLELKSQLLDSQIESKEIINFLQDEKSALAESLTETEAELKRVSAELEALRRESESRCSSLVRLSEQHKQEALKSHALLKRLEADSNAIITQKVTQVEEGAQAVRYMKETVSTLIQVLLKTYKVSPELLASSAGTTNGSGPELSGLVLDETDLRGSVLLPLITSLSNAFAVPIPVSEVLLKGVLNPVPPPTGLESVPPTLGQGGLTSPSPAGQEPNNSLQNLKQAILERDEAERLEWISSTSPVPDGEDYSSLMAEISELHLTLGKLVSVIRIIVIHCDRRVSNVASNILQVLKSSETDKTKMDVNGEMASVQKSLEAWSIK